MCQTDFIYDQEKYMCFYEEATKIMKNLDNQFLKFVQKEEYSEIHIPSLIKGEVLNKCGYFDTFQQHLTLAEPFSVSKKFSPGQLSEKVKKKYYLTPAACIHIYPMLEKRCKSEHCYTTLESVYRYENGNFHERGRIWEFTVREFVFVGSKEYVTDRLEKIGNNALVIAKQFFHEASLETACDIFCPSKENKVKAKMQLANNQKKELRINLDGESVAIASFNYHNYHFSKPFHFDKNNTIVSGCAGFGMERWVLGILDRDARG